MQVQLGQPGGHFIPRVCVEGGGGHCAVVTPHCIWTVGKENGQATSHLAHIGKPPKLCTGLTSDDKYNVGLDFYRIEVCSAAPWTAALCLLLGLSPKGNGRSVGVGG